MNKIVLLLSFIIGNTIFIQAHENQTPNKSPLVLITPSSLFSALTLNQEIRNKAQEQYKEKHSEQEFITMPDLVEMVKTNARPLDTLAGGAVALKSATQTLNAYDNYALAKQGVAMAQKGQTDCLQGLEKAAAQNDTKAFNNYSETYRIHEKTIQTLKPEASFKQFVNNAINGKPYVPARVPNAIIAVALAHRGGELVAELLPANTKKEIQESCTIQ